MHSCNHVQSNNECIQESKVKQWKILLVDLKICMEETAFIWCISQKYNENLLENEHSTNLPSHPLPLPPSIFLTKMFVFIAILKELIEEV